MKLGEITEWIEKTAPLKLQESYDNSGLIIGSGDHEVSRVVVCLDADVAALGFARENGAELIISHHPCVFRGVKVFNPDTMEGAVLFAAIANHTAVYSVHTNFDSVQGGMGDLLCEEIGLRSVSVLKPAFVYKEHGLGRVGSYKTPVPFNAFMEILKNKLGVGTIREVGERPEKVGKVAVLNGSFDRSVIQDLVNFGPDVLLTGDLKYHDALELRYRGIYALDAGHYKTEIIFVRAFSEMLGKAFPELKILSWEGEDIFRIIPAID